MDHEKRINELETKIDEINKILYNLIFDKIYKELRQDAINTTNRRSLEYLSELDDFCSVYCSLSSDEQEFLIATVSDSDPNLATKLKTHSDNIDQRSDEDV